ncbi:hypothetical protein M408DRAFT_295217 [Serendipita vermifera MAFF 305830]|uniref:C2H2-type domain-containing protein n=1 Tax=Serendipita vermifera MAFF 305830 TaxID=933852 RepID=A0A0C3BDL6_SERVB|nr:hypothetical protein M408DRAFT_295217 [Serendipita vermifera MAFF 305830]
MVTDKDADKISYSYVQENGYSCVSTTCQSKVDTHLEQREYTYRSSSYYPYVGQNSPGYYPSNQPYAREPGTSNAGLSTTGTNGTSSNVEPSQAYSYYAPAHRPMPYHYHPYVLTEPTEVQSLRYQEYQQPTPAFQMHWMPVEPAGGPARIPTAPPCQDQLAEKSIYHDVHLPLNAKQFPNVPFHDCIDAGKEGGKMPGAVGAEFRNDPKVGTRPIYTGHYIYESRRGESEPHYARDAPDMASNSHHIYKVGFESTGKRFDLPVERNCSSRLPTGEDHPHIRLPYGPAPLLENGAPGLYNVHGSLPMTSHPNHTREAYFDESTDKQLNLPAEQTRSLGLPMRKERPYTQPLYGPIPPVQGGLELHDVHDPPPMPPHPNCAHDAHFDESTSKQLHLPVEQIHPLSLLGDDCHPSAQTSCGLISLQGGEVEPHGTQDEPQIAPHPLYGDEVYREPTERQLRLPVETDKSHSSEQPPSPTPQLKLVGGTVRVRVRNRSNPITPSRKHKGAQQGTSSASERKARKGVHSTISRRERSGPINYRLSLGDSQPNNKHSLADGHAMRAGSNHQAVDAISQSTDGHHPNESYTYSNYSNSGFSSPVPYSSNNAVDCANQPAHADPCHGLKSPSVSRVRDHLPYPLDTCFNQSRPGDKWQLVLDKILSELRISFDMMDRYNDAELEEVLMTLCEQILYSIERGGSKGGVTSITCLISDCAKQFGKHNVARNFAHHLMKEHWQLNSFICSDAGCASTFAWPDDRSRHEKDQHNFVYESQS